MIHVRTHIYDIVGMPVLNYMQCMPGRHCQYLHSFHDTCSLQKCLLKLQVATRIMSYFEESVVSAKATDRSRRENEDKSLNQFIRDVASSIQLKVDNLKMTSSEVSSCRL